MFLRQKKGQSILEYAIMLAVVVAVLLIMQFFVKRGYQGNLKASADRMGEQFSGSGTTTAESTTMNTDQTIYSEVGTTSNTLGTFGLSGATSYQKGTLNSDAYSYTTKQGGTMTTQTQSRTDSADQEATRITEYNGTTVTDFDLNSI